MTQRVFALAALLGVVLLSSCQNVEPEARARRVVTRADLIGGPSALGEVGDYLLENDKIRVIVQDKGFSRGFGVYGGGLIDADLVRPIPPGGAAGGHGRDQFGELFPIALLQALEPNKVEVARDGRDGGAAVPGPSEIQPDSGAEHGPLRHRRHLRGRPAGPGGEVPCPRF